MNLPVIPEQASTYAQQMDPIFWTMVILTIVFTLLVTFIMLFCIVRFRRGAKVNRSNPSTGNLYLELTWSIIPMILGLFIYAWSCKPYAEVYSPPHGCNNIFLIGKRWMWHFQHTRSGIRENNQLHLEVGKPVKVTMISQDVIHGFYVPAFRVKRDCLPGRYNTVWFTPTRVGKYYLFCSEYCGTNHSEMGGYVYVMTPQDYAKWRTTGGSTETQQHETPVEIGQGVFQKYGCSNCHADKDNVHGPSLVGLYGTQVQLQGGGVAHVDTNFLRTAIVFPQKQRISGWPPTMEGYPVGNAAGEMSEEEMLDLIAYIKSLSPNNSFSHTGKQGAAPKTSHHLAAHHAGNTHVALLAHTDTVQSTLHKSEGKLQ